MTNQMSDSFWAWHMFGRWEEGCPLYRDCRSRRRVRSDIGGETMTKLLYTTSYLLHSYNMKMEMLYTVKSVQQETDIQCGWDLKRLENSLIWLEATVHILYCRKCHVLGEATHGSLVFLMNRWPLQLLLLHDSNQSYCIIHPNGKRSQDIKLTLYKKTSYKELICSCRNMKQAH